jgi:peptidoglycan glycosyltransferase
MQRTAHSALALGAGAVATAALTLALGSAGAAPAAPRPAAGAPPKRPGRAELLAGFDPAQRSLGPVARGPARVEAALVPGAARADAEQRFITPLAHGRRAVLTLDPALDVFVSELLARYAVPYAGVVAVEPQSGKLLAYVSHSSAEPGARDQARDATAPAASVFKLITAAALLDRGVKPETATCYHGGASQLTRAELVDNQKLDTACASLTSALGGSINAIFGKLALRHLDANVLGRYAGAFGFGEALPFELPTETSSIEVPASELEFARTAAGFWHMRMSPLHAAMIAATIANRGKMMRPQLVDRVLDERGKLLLKSEPVVARAVLERRTADQLGRMMRATVAQGTARKYFFDARGTPVLPGVEVAAKTGTLSRESPYRGYSWWVGFAPADAPKIALAVLLVNSPKWRIKAGYVGREALKQFLLSRPAAKRVELADATAPRADDADGTAPRAGDADRTAAHSAASTVER